MTKQAVVQGEGVPAETELAPISETAAILSVIERAARDPDVDVDKMERLFTMQQQAKDRDARIAFNRALAALQPKLPIVDENGAIVTGKGKDQKVQSTYAFWEDIIEAVRPLLAEHGFSLRFRTARDEAGVIVTGILSHEEGHSEETDLPLPPDASGSKNAVQAIASSISYGKRYTAIALLNITTKGEDDDGGAAGDGKPDTANEWRGPLNKTTLGNKFNAFCKALDVALDMEAVQAAWTEYKDVLAQVKEDAPHWWNGYTDVPGVERRLKEAKARARFVTNCRNVFAESPTLEQLQYVFEENQSDIRKLPNFHKNEVIRFKDERKAELERERSLA